jgi:ribosomal protein S27AE
LNMETSLLKTSSSLNIDNLEDLIKQHNELVRRNSRDRHRYRESCADCGEDSSLAPHELRRRTLRYVVANSVQSVVIWLARWRCRGCGRTFTDYPTFRFAL